MFRKLIVVLLPLAAALSPCLADDKASPLGETVHLAPVPGVTVDVPKGWVACDPDTDKLLGNAKDTQGLRQPICNPGGGLTYKLRAFDPRLFRTISMLIDQHAEQDISPADLDAITPDVATAITPQVCEAVTKDLTTDGTKIDSCVMTTGTLAGHKALVTTVVAVPPDVPDGKYELHIYELPYAKGYLEVQFNTPQLFVEKTRPVMDAIIATFTIE